ncbi:MAG: TonB-dependent receptor plug domain-containing protein, partial [Lentimicrobium sp.]|nr:TonB-dependent receptor plug domain-containing protein [Lentimicrobium sp.]
MKRIFATCFFIIFATAFGLAQSPVMDTVNLRAVEITERKPAALNRSAVPMQHLPVNEIKALPGSSVADALRSFSGVTIKDYGGLGGMKTVIVRSLGTNHTGIFIDGVPMSDVATGQVDLGKIPLEGLEEIELYIGQGNQRCLPARAQASASLLEFRSISPDFSKKKFRYSAGIKGGSFGLFNPYAGIYAKTGKSSFVNFSANYNNTRGDYPYVLKNGSQPDTMLKRDNADLRALNLNLGFETLFSDSSVLRVKTWMYAAERGLPGSVIYYNPWSVQRMDNRDLFSNIQYSRTSGKVRLLSNFTFTDGYLRYRDPAYLNEEGGLDN